MPEAGYKRCGKCEEEKPLNLFYRNSRSSDGRQSHCKVCDDARKKRWIKANMERHEEFTRRWKKNNPEAQAAIHKRSRRKQLERDPAFAVKAVERHRQRHPDKDRARRAVQRAVREGKLSKPECCERCKGQAAPRDLHGHHDDYSKPLEIKWLCRTCHKLEHADEH